MELSDIAFNLYNCGVIKFGDFTLKSGIKSPIYFDLRIIVSFPHLMLSISKLLHAKVSEAKCIYSNICGVPYTALPLATVISTTYNIPMVLKRREIKDYGTKKMIEGLFKDDEICLIIEDVVTSGSSVIETYQSLIDVQLKVTDAVVLLDREQGGEENLKNKGIKLHSVFTMSSLLEELEKLSVIQTTIAESIRMFIQNNKLNQKSSIPVHIYNNSLDNRMKLMEHPTSKRLFEIILTKNSNLCLAVDVTQAKKLIQIADQIGPMICCLKTHIDIISDFSENLLKELKILANKHNFLLMEDRKFSDIGNTVEYQFASGMFKINEWADLITIHGLSGPGILDALSKVNKKSAFILIAEMSSKGNLLNTEYTKRCVEIGEGCKDVIGFVCQKKLSFRQQIIHFTPGVNLKKTNDFGDQKYRSVQDAILIGGSDVIIVGRGILDANDPVTEARLYQNEGFTAYKQLNCKKNQN